MGNDSQRAAIAITMAQHTAHMSKGSLATSSINVRSLEGRFAQSPIRPFAYCFVLIYCALSTRPGAHHRIAIISMTTKFAIIPNGLRANWSGKRYLYVFDIRDSMTCQAFLPYSVGTLTSLNGPH